MRYVRVPLGKSLTVMGAGEAGFVSEREVALCLLAGRCGLMCRLVLGGIGDGETGWGAGGMQGRETDNGDAARDLQPRGRSGDNGGEGAHTVGARIALPGEASQGLGASEGGQECGEEGSSGEGAWGIGDVLRGPAMLNGWRGIFRSG
mmetsp:Transcript_23025/g.39491  ORF Transcript_23025/g.39491 Transcript_23025/m.39491 type:complete len:148 (+) Transcript_23025:71-514(+)